MLTCQWVDLTAIYAFDVLSALEGWLGAINFSMSVFGDTWRYRRLPCHLAQQRYAVWQGRMGLQCRVALAAMLLAACISIAAARGDRSHGAGCF